MDVAIQIADLGRKLFSNILQLASEPAILILDRIVDVSCVTLGICLCLSILVGLKSATQWAGKLKRQRARRVIRAFKTRGCRPNPPPSRSFSPTSLSAWIAAILVVSIVGIVYLCVQTPVLPPHADALQAHHHSTVITLPPSHYPTHPHWSEPSKRDHVHWMEDFGSSISSTITASQNFWTRLLPTNPGIDTQHATPQHSPADTMPGLDAVLNPDMCFYSSLYRAVQSPALTIDLKHISAHLCRGGTSSAATAAAATTAAAAAAAMGQRSNPIVWLQYTQSAVPVSNTSVPASTALLTTVDQTIATVPATAVAMYTPIAAVGMCAAAYVPTAVVLPATTTAGQAALDISEESTAVALYTETPLHMAWANLYWPMMTIGSPTMVILLLSDLSVESIFNYQYQDRAAATAFSKPMTSNIDADILPQLPSSSAAGRDNMNPTPEPSHSTSIVFTANDATWQKGQGLMERACPSLNQLAHLALLLLLLSGLRRIAAFVKSATKQSNCTREWEVSLLSKKIRWNLQVVDS